jgi:hypothetical protein
VHRKSPWQLSLAHKRPAEIKASRQPFHDAKQVPLKPLGGAHFCPQVRQRILEKLAKQNATKSQPLATG